MNFQKFLFALLLLCGQSCIAQRLIYSSQAIHTPYQGKPVKTIRPHWIFSPTVMVKYTDGTKEAVAKNSIWGYEDRRGRVYRCYRREFFKVVKVSDVVQYTIHRRGGHGNQRSTYFSQDLDSKLRWTKAKARRDAHVSR